MIKPTIDELARRTANIAAEVAKVADECANRSSTIRDRNAHAATLMRAGEQLRELGDRMAVLPANVARGTRDDLALASHGPTTNSARSTYRVLLIDDEAMLRRAMRRLLSPLHDVVVASDGRAALDLLVSGERFDVILCDMVMPVMDGAMFYAELLRTLPMLAPQVIFTTGACSGAAIDKFVAKHDPVILAKPISRELLLAMVNRVGENPNHEA